MLFGFRRQSIRNKRRAQNRYCHVLLYPRVKNTYCEGLVQDYRMDFTKLCKWLEDAIVILIIYPKASGHQRLAVNLTLFLILPRTYLHTSARFPRISPNHRHDMQLHLFLGSHVIPTGVTHLAFSLRHIFLRRKSIDFITIALTAVFVIVTLIVFVLYQSTICSISHLYHGKGVVRPMRRCSKEKYFSISSRFDSHKYFFESLSSSLHRPPQPFNHSLENVYAIGLRRWYQPSDILHRIMG